MNRVKFVSILFLAGLGLSSCLESESPDNSIQLEADLGTIDNYLSANGIVAFKDVNGIRFTIDSLGSGFPPKYDSKVTFNFTGKLLSGTVFQSGTLPDVEVKGLITGLQIGLPLIPNGSKATFYIPSVYAYGSQAQNNIPSGSNLIFQIFLKGITPVPAEKTQLGSDTTKIDNFLATAGIANVVKDTSGLRYVINEQGTGIKPSWLNKVKVAYTGYIINDNGTKGVKFYTGSNEPGETSDSRVVNFIRGFQLGLQQMPEGSKATLYIPSVLAFGPNQISGGEAIVPPNSNLLYEVELIDVLDP